MTSFLKLRCQTKQGMKQLDGLTGSSTIADLLSAISRITAIPVSRLRIKTGFPPKILDVSNPNFSLSEINVQSGDKLTVDEDSQSLAQTSGVSTAPVSILQSKGIKGILKRKVVPADNSCLFTSVNAVMTDGSVNLQVHSELRQIIAWIVSTDLDTYSEGFLGRPNSEYVSWIMNKDSWGGGIELSILSNYYHTEIAVVDCQSARIVRFGENENFDEHVFLLYDGVHYDPLVLEAPDGSGRVIQTRFDSSDPAVLAQAQEIGHEAKSTGQFTNVSEFNLRCLICRTPLKGNTEAQKHARNTGHVNFGEYKPSSPSVP